jgi:hypothetical protein
MRPLNCSVAGCSRPRTWLRSMLCPITLSSAGRSMSASSSGVAMRPCSNLTCRGGAGAAGAALQLSWAAWGLGQGRRGAAAALQRCGVRAARKQAGDPGGCSAPGQLKEAGGWAPHLHALGAARLEARGGAEGGAAEGHRDLNLRGAMGRRWAVCRARSEVAWWLPGPQGPAAAGVLEGARGGASDILSS